MKLFGVIGVQLIVLLLHYEQAFSSAQDRKPELVLYENLDKTGKSVRYSSTYYSSYDMTKVLAKANMAKVDLICVEEGVFILYPKKNHESDNIADIRILSKSDDGSCVSPGAQGPLSLRHASTSWFDMGSGSFITTFGKLHYGGKTPYTVGNISTTFIDSFNPHKSAIIVGNSSWMVTTKNKKTYCLVPYVNPNVTGYVPLCLIPDLRDVIDAKDLYWKKVVENCTGAQTTVNIVNCHNYANGDVSKPAVNNEKEPIENLTRSKETFLNNPECDKYDEIALLMRWRLTHNFADKYQYILPKNKEHAWRTELLDASFSVAEALFRNYIVEDINLLYQIREYFIYFAEKVVWSQGKGWPKDEPTHTLKVIVHQTQDCLVRLSGKEAEVIGRQPRWYKIIDKLEQPEWPKNLISERFRREKPLDIIMEFVWLIFNAVAVTCHYSIDYETNFWIEYNDLVNDMYLVPMSALWVDSPGVNHPGLGSNRLYHIILGGYDLTYNYNRLAVATSDLYKLVKFMDTNPRPSAVLWAVAHPGLRPDFRPNPGDADKKTE